MKKIILLLGLMTLSPITSFAQSPGGVSSNLTLWLKADNATTITGSPIQKWTTSGGSATGYNVSQANAANMPILVNGATNDAHFNYNPSVKFSAANQTQLYTTVTSPNLLGGNGTAIVVASQAGDTGSAFTYNCYAGGSGSPFDRYQLKPSWRFQTANAGIGGIGYTFDWTAPIEYPTTAATIFASYGCGPNAALRTNSVMTTTPSNASATYYPGVHIGLYLGANNATEYTNSNVAEVILFNTKPSAADMDRVETYLAIKYGITRGGNTNITSAYNYIASDGTVIWDKTLNSSFNNDIAVLGRDDNSGLNQKQSISANNGEAVTIALGNASIPTENTTNTNTFSSNISFLTWGNNGLAKTFDATATKPAGISARLNRVWKTQATNFSQQTTFGFETSQIPVIETTETLCLLFDDDGVDLSNATVVAAGFASNPTGSRIEFTGINIPAAKPYFTLAKAINIPVFNDVTMTGYTVSYTLPTLSDNISPIPGTWSPAQIVEGDNTCTFTPDAGQNAISITKSFLLLNQQAIDAVDDDFSSTPIVEGVGYDQYYDFYTPSVFSNDSIIFDGTVNSNNATYSLVSITPNNWDPNDLYYPAIMPDGTIKIHRSFTPGTYSFTYQITSRACTTNPDTATATVVLKEPNTAKKVAAQLTDTVVVYPNPSNGIFHIDLANVQGEYDNVEVYSVLGTKIYESRLSPKGYNILDLSNVATGCYITKVSGKSGSNAFQLIKQ